MYPPRPAYPRGDLLQQIGVNVRWQEFDVLRWFCVGDVLQSVGEPLLGIEVVETTGGEEAVVHGHFPRQSLQTQEKERNFKQKMFKYCFNEIISYLCTS